VEMMQYDKFIYKKVVYWEDSGKYYLWYLINKDRREGVNFHGKVYTDPEVLKYRSIIDTNKWGFSTLGIEAHRKKSPYEREDYKPCCIEYCDVTGGKCYPDGSSMAADRLKHINPDNMVDDGYVWNVLHEFYDIWIERKKEDAA
jgi:hypothetical protein